MAVDSDMAFWISALTNRNPAASFQYLRDSDPLLQVTVFRDAEADDRIVVTLNALWATTEGSESAETVATLVSSRTPLGGARWWWKCPQCLRKRKRLYFKRNHWGPFACRECRNLTYLTRQENRRVPYGVFGKAWADAMVNPIIFLQHEMAEERTKAHQSVLRQLKTNVKRRLEQADKSEKDSVS
jgi:hypothetical protein